jgi:serine/threonine protein kinase
MLESPTADWSPTPEEVRQFERACDAFEVALRAGQQPNIEQFLAEAPASMRKQLLDELVKLDRAYRNPVPPAETDPPGADSVGGSGDDPVRARSGGGPQPQVPGYEIVGKLGRGGMGVVYQARQTALKRLVALKMILSGDYAGPDELARFRIEAEALARLQHPNIVQIHEVGDVGGAPYFSLEFCAGGSLEARLNGSPMPPREVARLVEVLADAIEAAHEAGIVHRDLKPGNVLLAADGTPKIADFGLAKKLDEGTGQTATGAILGTPSYMAPEQAAGKGKTVGPAADIYALGAMLYELLTGRPPFVAGTPLDVYLQVLSQEPVPPRYFLHSLPRDLEIICLKCLRKEPEKRYRRAADLANDLRLFLRGRPIRARAPYLVEEFVLLMKRDWVLFTSNALAANVLMLVPMIFAAGNKDYPVLPGVVAFGITLLALVQPRLWKLALAGAVAVTGGCAALAAHDRDRGLMLSLAIGTGSAAYVGALSRLIAWRWGRRMFETLPGAIVGGPLAWVGAPCCFSCAVVPVTRLTTGKDLSSGSGEPDNAWLAGLWLAGSVLGGMALAKYRVRRDRLRLGRRTAIPSRARPSRPTVLPEPSWALPATGEVRSLPATKADQPSSSAPSQEGVPAADLPRIPGYQILGVAGRGATGVVYRAQHIVLKRLVALKMLQAAGHADETDRQRLLIEARAVARLQHPGIVEIHEIGEANGQPYLAMEFVGGGSLSQRQGGRPIAASQAAELVQTLALAVQAAHDHGVLHRDLKPANVLFTPDGQSKIADFGLAKLADEEAGLTRTQAVLGTPSYMSPEQASGQTRQVGPPTDVYGLGAILYELLTGYPPFRGANDVDTLRQVCGREPVPPRDIRPVPRALEAICLKCLRKAPRQRYVSARALADDLGRFQAGEPTEARPPRIRWRFGPGRDQCIVPADLANLGLILVLITAMACPASCLLPAALMRGPIGSFGEFVLVMTGEYLVVLCAATAGWYLYRIRRGPRPLLTPSDLVPQDEGGDSPVLSGDDGWITVPLRRLLFPPICSGCEAPTTETQLVRIRTLTHTLEIPLPVCPACQADDGRERRGGIVGGGIALVLMALPAGFFLRIAWDPMDLGRSVPGLITVAICCGWIFWRAGYALGRFLAGGGPMQTRRYSWRKGTVQFRFRRAEYAGRLAASIRGAPPQQDG